ncbi:hypothetical protein ACWEKT_14155 [Nocardia takedensis]
MRYLVKSHPCGASSWIVHVPAVDRWSLTTDKKSIAGVARMMIANVIGAPVDSFDVDLRAGRAVESAEEFAAGSPLLLRWAVRR